MFDWKGKKESWLTFSLCTSWVLIDYGFIEEENRPDGVRMRTGWFIKILSNKTLFFNGLIVRWTEVKIN